MIVTGTESAEEVTYVKIGSTLLALNVSYIIGEMIFPFIKT